MANRHGEFIWYELITSDVEAAARFYGEVVGWRSRDSGVPGKSYRLWSAADGDVGGLMALPAGASAAGMRPGWIGYIGVEDVDAAVAQVVEGGGAVHMPATDMPGVGRLAMMSDPQGPLFYLMRGASPEPSRAFAHDLPGHFGWNELHAADRERAFNFYSARFGWKQTDTFDMGPMGVYQLFGTGGERAVGGIMTRPKDAPPPTWLYYINVDDIQSALGRLKSAGGQLLHGPSEVPGGQLIVQALDPQGAMFALVGPAKV